MVILPIKIKKVLKIRLFPKRVRVIRSILLKLNIRCLKARICLK